MPRAEPCTRRWFLASALSLAAGCGVWRPEERGADREPSREPDRERLAELLDAFSEPEAAARIGALLLRTGAPWRDEPALLRALFAPPRWRSPRPALDLFREQVREDFERQRVVRVRGWALARSEGELFALVAHAARDGKPERARR